MKNLRDDCEIRIVSRAVKHLSYFLHSPEAASLKASLQKVSRW